MAAKTRKTIKSKRVECPNCGAKNSIKSKFCHSCGAKLEIIESKVESKARSAAEVQKENKKAENKLIFGHFKPKFFLIIGVIVVIVIVGGFFLLTNTNLNNQSSSSQPILSCTATSCQSGYYCSSYGACLKAYCGDAICTAQERANNSCAIDCGCTNGYVVNRYTNQCQAPANVSNSTITAEVNAWLKQMNTTGTITNITNTYYGNQSVKQANVNCAPQNATYPCQIVFYVNNSGKILNVTRTD